MVSLNLENPMLLESFTTPFPVRQFSVAEYEAMARAGVLTEDDNVELLEGWIAPKMTKNPWHESVISRLNRILGAKIPQTYHIRLQSVISTRESRPEPDLAIVRGEPGTYDLDHPQAPDIALVVEVADTSLARDRIKRRIYARAGIPNYWIVNLSELCVEVFTDPVDGDDAHYQNGFRYLPSETLALTFADDISFEVTISDFLIKR